MSLHRLAGALDAARPDLVHTHLIHADFHVALVKQVRRKLRTISTKHGYEEKFNNDHGFDASKRRQDLYYRMSQLVEHTTNRSFTISEGLRSFFVDAGISDRRKLDMIHYGFDFEAVKLDPDRAKYRFGDPQLCIVGRLVKFKGHRWAIEALVKVREKHPGTKLVVVGGGALDEELRATARRHGVADAVVFTGFKSNVHDYMAASDVVLVPSVSEGFGVVFLEAQRNQRPVVAFDVPAANEIIVNEETGLLVRPYDVDAYARAIVRLLDDSSLHERLATGAKRRLESYFTADRMTSQTVDFYRRVLEAR